MFKDEDLFIDVLNASMGEDEHLPHRQPAQHGPGHQPAGGRGAGGDHADQWGRLPAAVFWRLCRRASRAILLRILGTQELTVEAALKADRKLAIQALVAGETVKTEAEAEKMMDVILDTHREYLPQFFG